MHVKHTKILLLLLILVLTLSSCKSPTAGPQPAETLTALTAVPVTPTVESSRLVYVTTAPTEGDANAAILSAFAAANSLKFETFASIEAAALTGTEKIVVLQQAAENQEALLSGAPQTQFISLSGGDADGKSNLSVVTAKPEDVAFMAGYLSTLIAYDWRSAALLTTDGPLGAGEADAFWNGGKFVCGKCNPVYPPMVDLPQIINLASGSDAASWLAAANQILPNWAEAVYLDAEAATPEVLDVFAAAEVTVLSTIQPPADSSAYWGATISANSSEVLQTALENALAGQGGQTYSASIVLTNVNPDLVSPAKQDLFNQTAALVAAGKIGTLSIP